MSTKVRGRSEKWHQHILLAISICVALALIAGILAAAEFIARRMEPKVSGWIGHTPHDRLGWVPTPGRGQLETGEFKASFSINALHMNDREFEPATLRAKHRVLALGDSHTFAVGASTEETWPKQVETRLFADRQSGVVFNAGVIGYSVGQYLEMYRKHRQTLMPTTVLVGFSMATDLYDLIPPERGGFIYGGDASRVYFDLDGQGNLLEKQHDSTKMNEKTEHQRDASHGLRSFLGQFALFRTLKRSQLAMAVAMYYRPGGKSLWPGLDTALKINLSDDDAYRWLLAERILGRLADEAKRDGAQEIGRAHV